MAGDLDWRIHRDQRGAVVGMADHVATADQKYRLIGLSMFMTQESARKLSMGMNALGASLEQIAWDPELNKNFLELGRAARPARAGTRPAL